MPESDLTRLSLARFLLFILYTATDSLAQPSLT